MNMSDPYDMRRLRVTFDSKNTLEYGVMHGTVQDFCAADQGYYIVAWDDATVHRCALRPGSRTNNFHVTCKTIHFAGKDVTPYFKIHWPKKKVPIAKTIVKSSMPKKSSGVVSKAKKSGNATKGDSGSSSRKTGKAVKGELQSASHELTFQEKLNLLRANLGLKSASAKEAVGEAANELGIDLADEPLVAQLDHLLRQLGLP
jgi:hypothetical protein